jgi:hypothetical protein
MRIYHKSPISVRQNADRELYLDAVEYQQVCSLLQEEEDKIRNYLRSHLILFPGITAGDMMSGKWEDLSIEEIEAIKDLRKELGEKFYREKYQKEFCEYEEMRIHAAHLSRRIRIWDAIKKHKSGRTLVQLEQVLLGLLEEENDCDFRLKLLRAFVEELSRLGCFLEFITPLEISDFIMQMSSDHQAKAILDPTCGSAFLLAQIAKETAPSIIHGVDVNPIHLEIGQRVVAKASFFKSDIFDLDKELEPEYDLIVADPFLQLRMERPERIPGLDNEAEGEFADGLAVWASQRLSDSGVAMLVVDASFHNTTTRRMLWGKLEQFGAYIRACIHFPLGRLHGSSMDTYLVVIDREKRDRIFVAQYSPAKEDQQYIVNNYQRHQAKGPTAHGRLVSWEDFNGFSAIEAGEMAKKKARDGRLGPVPLSSLIPTDGVQKFTKAHIKPSEPKLNCVYIPVHRGKVVATQDELPETTKNYFQVQLDDDRADAQFVVLFLNSELGQIVLDTIRTDGSGAYISDNKLEQLILYLPERDGQRNARALLTQIHGLQLELGTLEAEVLESPGNIDELKERVQKVNHEDRPYDDWLEALPFPLASILWLHHTEKPGHRRYEVLLQFFEGLAQFMATLFISALQQDEDGWPELKVKLNKALQKENLTFERSTFGTWKTTCEVLGSYLRKVINDKEEKFEWFFKTRKPSIRKSLFDVEILGLLEKANKARNDSKGHGGAMGEAKAESLNKGLQALVEDYRAVVGESWKNYQLVQPQDCRYREGHYHYSVQNMTGTRTPFITEERECYEVLDDDSLYILDADFGRGLKLQPFFQIMPAPKTAANACYFYNREENEEHRLVSYHFAEEAEVYEPNYAIAEALNALKVPNLTENYLEEDSDESV